MGTRSTVKFYSEFNKEQVILSVYQQYDGYLSGVGVDLATWLSNKKVINGIREETMANGYANGMGCLAAQYVADHKVNIGGFYLTNNEDEQEYNYEVKLIDNQIIIEVDGFKGTPAEFLEYVSLKE